MKLLGMIGGMSWESTLEYYRIVNEMVKEKLGGWNSARLLLYSVNFDEILNLQNKNEWDELAEIILKISNNLELAGCDAIMICSNTMHRIANIVEAKISIPLIHVVDATAERIKEAEVGKVGLLGTKFTMEGGFYTDRLMDKHNLKVLLPNSVERDFIHKAIYNELAQGKFLEDTKKEIIKTINGLIGQGAEGIILGCTELPLIIKPEDIDIPLFDTLRIHLEASTNFIMD
ncbi:MAG: amino acid racemase [Candidatus Lokiarchaeota archaeon]|nr:amino acid racemase [Candidatus Lokiarchaeota archaeon]MBD3198911.1 amino acid racemase [Candidatus Lokiarchaeota archaeon]